MKEHRWVIEEVDSGHLGINTFWKCADCDASGGPAFSYSVPKWYPFYADGSGLKVGNDCDIAKELIKKHLEVK